MSSPASRPRPRPITHRSRRQRLAAGAVLATTSLLGTYLAAIRPHPTYAAPNTGSEQGDPWVSSANSGLCAIADDTTVYDDTSLRTAVTQSNDGDVICIGASIQLSGPLNIDDTSLTLIGDDDSTTLTAASGSQIVVVDFSDGTNDDTLSFINLTLTGGDDTSTNGGAIYASGEGETLLLESTTFINNMAGNGGAISTRDMEVSISNSTFDSNRGWTGGRGGALYINNNLATGISINGSSFTRNELQPDGTSNGGGIGGALRFRGPTTGIRIENSYFADNSSGWFAGNSRNGGAIFSNAYVPLGAAPGLVIVGTTFKENRAYQGGAIYTSYGSGLEIEASVFTNNYAGSSGGAVRSYDRAQIDNSLFRGNDSNGGLGGAVYLAGYDPFGQTPNSTIASSSFINNGDDTAPDKGGGGLQVLRRSECCEFTLSREHGQQLRRWHLHR